MISPLCLILKILQHWHPKRRESDGPDYLCSINQKIPFEYRYVPHTVGIQGEAQIEGCLNSPKTWFGVGALEIWKQYFLSTTKSQIQHLNFTQYEATEEKDQRTEKEASASPLAAQLLSTLLPPECSFPADSANATAYSSQKLALFLGPSGY